MAERTRRSVLVAGAALAAGLAGCSYPQPRGPVGFDEGFEGGIAGWERGTDAPRADGDWRIAATEEAAATGFRSARFDLGEEAGSLWLERRLAVDPDAAYRANVAAAARGGAGDVGLFLDTVPPDGAFPPGDAGIREPLSEGGWRGHAFSRTIRPDDAGALHVAVGIASDGGTGATAYVDDVKVTVVSTS